MSTCCKDFKDIASYIVLLVVLSYARRLFGSVGRRRCKRCASYSKRGTTQDIRLFPHRGTVFWYSLLSVALVAAPFMIAPYYLGELSFLFIWSLAGLSLMVLTGYAGLISIGHAAFLGIGAYVHVYPICRGRAGSAGDALGGRRRRRRWGRHRGPGDPDARALSCHCDACLQCHRARGFRAVGNGYRRFRGVAVPKPQFFGWSLEGEVGFDHLCLAVLVLCILAILNLLRAPTGRAWIAIRDSEIAAQSMGVNLAGYKTLVFAVSAFLAGLAGALFAHKVGYLTPDSLRRSCPSSC